MASKKVSFGTKPQQQPNVDAWVENREGSKDEITKQTAAADQSGRKTKAKSKTKKAEKAVDPNAMKRLTLDIPENLHRQIKGKAVMEGVTMVNMLRELLEETYG